MNYYLVHAIILFVYMNLWFMISLLKKRNDVADIAWGLGFVTLAWTAFAINGDFSLRPLLVNILVTVWGIRLGLHILFRNRGKKEDYRYIEWRNQWGRWFVVRSYTQVFILQGVLLYLIVLPVLFINNNYGALTLLDFFGISIWVTGFIFEAVGDRQLAHHVNNPLNKGKIMQMGLWKYSRHPNYFGEVTQWWGIFVMALALPNGWMTIVGPLTISILILFVSGIPLLEKKYEGRADFEEYKKRTSIFFPFPPRA